MFTSAVLFFFRVENVFVRHKNTEIFSSKIKLDEKLENVEDDQQPHSPSFSSLAAVRTVLFTCEPQAEYQLRP